MTAARLREAAIKLRGLAEQATPGPWEAAATSGRMVTAQHPQIKNAARAVTITPGDWDDGKPTAQFIATMDPVVAGLLADLLESVARAATMAGVAAEHPEALSIRAEADSLAEAVLA